MRRDAEILLDLPRPLRCDVSNREISPAVNYIFLRSPNASMPRPRIFTLTRVYLSHSRSLFFFMRALLLRDAAHSTRADASFLRDRQR